MKIEQNSPTQAEAGVLKVHFFYVVLILAGLLILVLTNDWTKLSGFTDYLSVAATITSLVLGVLAIIYSFVSNGSMSQFLGSIETSTSAIRGVSVDLRDIAASARDIQERADERTERLQQLATDLRLAIVSLHERTTAIADRVDAIPLEIQTAIAARSEPEAQPAEITQGLAELWTEQRAISFLMISSRLGISAIRALNIATSQDQYCDLKRLFDRDGEKDFEYIYGFLIAAVSSGLIELDQLSVTPGISGIARLSKPSQGLQNALDTIWKMREQDDTDGTKEFFARMNSLIPKCIAGAETFREAASPKK